MGILQDAASAWDTLCKIKYNLIIVRSQKLIEINLQFSAEDFSHISGLQHTKDVDIGLNPNEYYGDKILKAINKNRIEEEMLEKSTDWPVVFSRLNSIVSLESILDSSFTIAEFHSDRLPFYSKINAKYIIRNSTGDNLIFVFLDERSGNYYCKSAFSECNLDYMANQPVFKVLKKIKSDDNGSIVLFKHPNFRE